jgi:hypothetical protein
MNGKAPLPIGRAGASARGRRLFKIKKSTGESRLK